MYITLEDHMILLEHTKSNIYWGDFKKFRGIIYEKKSDQSAFFKDGTCFD